MSIEFTWKGVSKDAEGVAVYTTDRSTYEIRLPNFEKAWQIAMMLRDAYSEGRRTGYTEMIEGVRNAMNNVMQQWHECRYNELVKGEKE